MVAVAGGGLYAYLATTSFWKNSLKLKTMSKLLRVGIATVQEQRARSWAIAAGTRQRSAEEPQVWFPSVAAMARVLSAENMALLKAVREQRPYSMDALAEAVGKQAPNVSRSLHPMAAYGLVEFVKNGRTVTPQTTFKHLSVEFCQELT